MAARDQSLHLVQEPSDSRRPILRGRQRQPDLDFVERRMRDDPDPRWRLRRCRHSRYLSRDSQRAPQRLSLCRRRSTCERKQNQEKHAQLSRTRSPDAVRLCLQARLSAMTRHKLLPSAQRSASPDFVPPCPRNRCCAAERIISCRIIIHTQRFG